MIQYRSTIPGHSEAERVAELDTVEQALLLACTDLRSGTARPVGIYAADGALLHDAQSIQNQCIELADEQ